MSIYEIFIGFRYLKSKKSQGFISFNTILSIGIVFIGVFILIIVTSVMSGFQSQIKDKILDVDSHITVTQMFTDSSTFGLSSYKEITEKLLELKSVTSADPFIDGQGLLRYRENISYVMVRGIGEKNQIPDHLQKFIVQTDINSKSVNISSGVYIGLEMSYLNNITIGDTIEIIVPKGRLTAREGISPGLKKYRVKGFFKTGYYDFDTRLVIMSLPEAQSLYEVGNIASGIGVKVDDIYNIDRVASRIQAVTGIEYAVRTAEERNHNLFYALRLEKLIMTIILFLVIISAGFTIMGTLAMVVMEKRKAVGILKSMGARPYSIMIIFILEGFLIGIIGTISGVLLGLAAALNLENIIQWIELSINQFMSYIYEIFNLGTFYKIILVPTNVYYIDSIPAQVDASFVTFIAIFAVFLSTVAAIFPAWQASRLKPVETMRYE